MAGEKAVHPSPEHHSLADLGAVIRQKPAVVKHPITSQLGREKRLQLWKYCLEIQENKRRKERRGKGKLAVKFIVLPISTDSSCWERTLVQLSSCSSVALSRTLQKAVRVNPCLDWKSGLCWTAWWSPLSCHYHLSLTVC